MGVGSTDFIGTTSATDLVFKTNNLERVIIKGNTGGFRIISLQGTGNALVRTDANGELSRINYPNNNQYVLDGNGNFVTINSLVTSALVNSLVTPINVNALTGWTSNASTVTLTNPNANVGIGVTNPTCKLEVLGCANIHGELLADSIHVKSIQVGDSSIHIVSAGDVTYTTVSFIDPITLVVTTTVVPIFANTNQIYTDPTSSAFTLFGSLNINCRGNSPNTHINGYKGKVFIGTSSNAVVYGNNIHSIYRAVVKQGLMITGKNGTLGFRGGVSGVGGYQSPNQNGDIAIEFTDQPNGGTCANPIKGLNIYRPFGHDAGFSNYDLFISTSKLSGANTIAPGNVGIGTPYPKYKLSVEGTIGAREVIVETASWCDFVFENDYKLMTYDALRDYIKVNKHLPNIPSEEEVIKNGITVSTILKGHTQTIEEIVLYVLDLESKYTGLENRYTALEKKYDELIEKLNK